MPKQHFYSVSLDNNDEEDLQLVGLHVNIYLSRTTTLVSNLYFLF